MKRKRDASFAIGGVIMQEIAELLRGGLESVSISVIVSLTLRIPSGRAQRQVVLLERDLAINFAGDSLRTVWKQV